MPEDELVIDENGQDHCETSARAVGEVSIVTPRVLNRSLGDSFTDETGIVWMKVKPAAEHFGGGKRLTRNIKLWIDDAKLPGKQFEKGGRAPFYVDMEALQEFLMERHKVRIRQIMEESGADERGALFEAMIEAGEIEAGEVETSSPSTEVELAAPAIESVFEQVRELNEDWRAAAAEQSSKVEQLLTDQLERERERVRELEKEVVDLRVKTALQEQAETVDVTDEVNLLETDDESKPGFWAKLLGK